MIAQIRRLIQAAGIAVASAVGAVVLSVPIMCVAQMSAHPAGPVSSSASSTVASSTGEANSETKRAQQVYFQTLATFLLNHERAKAEQGFLRVTQIDRSYAPAWFNLGVFSEGDQNWPRAKWYFERYIRLAPTGPDAERAKKQVQILSKYIDGTITPEAAKQAEYNATIQRARAFLSAGLFREAIAEAGRAQAADRSRWEAYAVVALCMAKQHNHAEAVKFQALAVNHAPAGKREQIQDALANKISNRTH